MDEVKVIKLGNRYRTHNSLIQSKTNPNKFFLIFGDLQEADWCRVLYKNGEKDYNCKDYFAVDPSGGPFMAIGGHIENYVIEHISEEELTKEEYPELSKQKKAFTFYMKQEEKEQKIVYTFEKRKEEEMVSIPAEGICTINSDNYVQTTTDDI